MCYWECLHSGGLVTGLHSDIFYFSVSAVVHISEILSIGFGSGKVNWREGI